MLIPELVEVTTSGSTSRVGVSVYNIGSKSVTIPAKTVVAELHSAEVVPPKLDRETKQSVIPNSVHAVVPIPDSVPAETFLSLDSTRLDDQQKGHVQDS